MLNRIILIGRLTRDVELRTTKQGDSVGGFTLAVNRRFQKDETDFIPVVVWKQLAENCEKYLGKGSMAAVDGRLQLRSYEDKDGNKRTVAEVVAESVQFLDSRKREGTQNTAQGAAGSYDESAITEDDVPF